MARKKKKNKRVERTTARVRAVDFTHAYHTGRYDDQGEAIYEVDVSLYESYADDRLVAVRVSVYGHDDFGMAQDWPATGLLAAKAMYAAILAEGVVSETSLATLGLKID